MGSMMCFHVNIPPRVRKRMYIPTVRFIEVFENPVKCTGSFVISFTSTNSGIYPLLRLKD